MGVYGLHDRSLSGYGIGHGALAARLLVGLQGSGPCFRKVCGLTLVAVSSRTLATLGPSDNPLFSARMIIFHQHWDPGLGLLSAKCNFIALHAAER